MTPTDALFELFHLSLLCSTCDPRKPGSVVAKARPEVREAIKRLTSDEIQKIRIEPGVNI